MRNANDKPEYGKQYALTGGTGAKCIANGNTWAESEIKSEIKNEYTVERFDSRNTSYTYLGARGKVSLEEARKVARELSRHSPKAVVEGPDGFFEDFEDGSMVSWSVAGHPDISLMN